MKLSKRAKIFGVSGLVALTFGCSPRQYVLGITPKEEIIEKQNGDTTEWLKDMHPWKFWAAMSYDEAERTVEKLNKEGYMGRINWAIPTQKDLEKISSHITESGLWANVSNNIFPIWTSDGYKGTPWKKVFWPEKNLFTPRNYLNGMANFYPVNKPQKTPSK